MQKAQILTIALCLCTVGCTTTKQPGFEERDRFVVNTPSFYDNRVFYVSANLEQAEYPLKRADQLKDDPNLTIVHGSPLSLILNNVTLPPSQAKGTKDIAVVLEIGTASSGDSAPVVAWYQRGVRADQPLNFSNLLIHFEPRWDARVAPFVRIRVVDVSSEKNEEARDALAQVGALAQGGSPFIPGASQAAVSLGIKAASLVISNRANTQLLDYTVQFYSEEAIAAANGSGLTPLRRGRILLVGRPLDQSSAYWVSFKGSLDPASTQVYSNGNPVVSPVVTLTVSVAQSIVPAIVAQRSSYLTTLLTAAQQADLTAVKAAGRSVYDGARTFAVIESVRRNRDPGSLEELIQLEQNAGSEKVADDDRALIRSTLKELTHCNVASSAAVLAWKKANPNGFVFEDRTFKLKGDVCPS
ncbi:translation initiation factor eIF-2B alpha/beta/delta subunit family protein [Rubrivivax gelatinosus]|uniref:Lipoprotein n=2 Tax=Rubrivivax gelatinosus TaxID=28068 RepID=A0ABS1DYT7_RUBGE|nr:hypothetical protein [Rubrivivax gelatinosus]MBK1714986.1 hypothetical protein [Rubrivivax gelatinosus]